MGNSLISKKGHQFLIKSQNEWRSQYSFGKSHDWYWKDILSFPPGPSAAFAPVFDALLEAKKGTFTSSPLPDTTSSSIVLWQCLRACTSVLNCTQLCTHWSFFFGIIQNYDAFFSFKVHNIIQNCIKLFFVKSEDLKSTQNGIQFFVLLKSSEIWNLNIKYLIYL